MFTASEWTDASTTLQ